MAINFNDPKAALPVAGQPGHFAHHEWIKDAALRDLDARLKVVETATAPLPKDAVPGDKLDLTGATTADQKIMALIAYLDTHGTVVQ